MKIKCKKCGAILSSDTIGFFKCKCGSIYLDVCYINEDGVIISRIGGNLSDIEQLKD